MNLSNESLTVIEQFFVMYFLVLFRSFSQSGLCIDTVDGTVGSKPGLWKCHDSGGNQVIHTSSVRKHGHPMAIHVQS